MMEINITSMIDEFKQEVRRLRHERDILRLIAVDEVQLNRNISRSEAELKVDQEVFDQLRRVL